MGLVVSLVQEVSGHRGGLCLYRHRENIRVHRRLRCLGGLHNYHVPIHLRTA